MSWLESITNSMDMNLRKLQRIMEKEGAWHVAVSGVEKYWNNSNMKLCYVGKKLLH